MVQTIGARFAHGLITLEAAQEMGCRACGTPGGGCQFLGTAATAQVVGEALGPVDRVDDAGIRDHGIAATEFRCRPRDSRVHRFAIPNVEFGADGGAGQLGHRRSRSIARGHRAATVAECLKNRAPDATCGSGHEHPTPGRRGTSRHSRPTQDDSARTGSSAARGYRPGPCTSTTCTDRG